ncbi:phosphotransferase enzyme family protein [Rufibacter psychrotolerans]|uniref:phosphotransferase enzyme family protein n=1 Tax=Rufibacter psychrotolerans TaxID=2812556 RepID=UPI001966EAA0|nr:phosphotransferase [Rufibacter sp. SYSU D00308]
MPSVFPTSYSTFDSSALASFLAGTYGLGPATCQLLLRGVGDTYLVQTAGDRFILRVYRATHRSLPQIEAETTLLLALQEAGVPVSYPLADLNGKVIQALPAAEGTRHAVLFTYAPGQSVPQLNPTQLRLLGQQMAQFHNVSAHIELNGSRWTFDVETTLVQPLEQVKAAFTEFPEDYAWLQEVARQTQDRLARLDTSGFSTGYCHFDLMPKNFHFVGDAQLTFFDFDFFGRGWLVNDLMTFWEQLCLDVLSRRMTQEEAKTAFATLVEAYRAHRPLSEEELRAISSLSVGFWFFYLGFYPTHDQFTPHLLPHRLQQRLHLFRRLHELFWNRE